jgi:hypothetical protein
MTLDNANGGLVAVCRGMAEAAGNYLASLTPAQRLASQFAFSEAHRLSWGFLPLGSGNPRHGVPWPELQESQRLLVQGLLRTGLSEAGYAKAVGIVEVEAIQHPQHGSRSYSLWIYGVPSLKGQWMWRFEGHHLSLSFTVLGDQGVATTPSFWGVSPTRILDNTANPGVPVGTRVLAAEDDLLMGPEEVLLRAPTPQAEAITHSDRTADVDEAERWLGDLSALVRQASSYEHALLLGTPPDSDEEVAMVAGLRDWRLHLEFWLLVGWQRANAIRASGRWDADLLQAQQELKTAITEWDATFARLVYDRLLASAVGGDPIFDLLSPPARGVSWRWEGECSRCTIPTLALEFTPFNCAARLVVDCPLCGPLVNRRVGGPGIVLGLPGATRRGAPAAIEATADVPGQAEARDGFLVTEVRDKTKPSPFHLSLTRHRLASGRFTIPFELPADSGYYRYSIRLIWVGGLDVVYARRAFVLMPDPDFH